MLAIEEYNLDEVVRQKDSEFKNATHLRNNVIKNIRRDRISSISMLSLFTLKHFNCERVI